MIRNKKLFLWLVGLIAIVMIFPTLHVLAADKFPTKAIKLVIPYSPGGGSDLSARIFAKYASNYLPEKVIVTNITGAGGRTAEHEVSRARPDGYTLLWQHQALHMSYATGLAKYNYTIYDAVASTVKAYSAMVVSKNSPFKTITALLAAGKAKPGTIKVGASMGGTSHFAFMSILDAAKANESDFQIIGMTGDKDRIIGMLQGNIDTTAITLSSARPYLKSGDIILLGVMAEERSDAYPDLPTLAEKGVNAVNRFDYTTWSPKGTPKEVIKIIADAWIKTAKDPACQKELKKGWMLPELYYGEKLEQFNKQQFDFFMNLAKKFKIKK
jgi:tripartite-type tricarboxylate transporter receptor subunit TctC